MIPTDQPSGSSQMLRIDLPSTLMAFLWHSFYRSTPIPETTEIFALDLGRSLGANLPAPKTCRRFAAQSVWRRPVAAIDYEVEYNNRARVPEHPEIFARWTHEAELYRAEALKVGRAQFGLPYGDTPRQVVDLFFPAASEAAPVAIFVHG